MNELGFPPMSAIEWAVIFGALLLFSIVPGALTWAEGVRERRAQALADAAALQALRAEAAIAATETVDLLRDDAPVAADAEPLPDSVAASIAVPETGETAASELPSVTELPSAA